MDDGSEDGSIEVIETFSALDKRITLIKRAGDKGAQNCRNIGLEKAKGEYVVFVDSDDILASFCLKQRLDLIKERANLDFIVFPQLIFYNFPGDTNLLINIASSEPAINRFFTLCYYQDVPWINGAAIFKRQSLIEKSIKWDPKLKGYQDVAFHLECLIAGLAFEFANRPPDYYYRIHNEDRIGKEIFAGETLVSTEYMLIFFFQKLKMNGSLNDEVKSSIQRTCFHALIRKWLILNKPESAYLCVKRIRKKRIISLITFFQIRAYIYFYSSKLKVFNSIYNRVFYRIWRRSFFRISVENYLQHYFKICESELN